MPPSERVSRAVLELTTDNTGFEADLAKAEARAKAIQEAFSKTGESVTTDIRRVASAVRDFSGLDAANKAEEYAAAVQKLGGVSKLTAADQVKVNAAMKDALEHYRALGVEAPAHLAKLEKATKGVHESSGLLDEQFARMTAAFGAGALLERATEGLLEFGKGLVEDASNIVDLSTKTGFSTRAIQIYGAAAKAAGSDVNAVADGVYKFGIAVSEGADGTKTALKELGVEYASLRDMAPEDQFAKVVDALHNVTDAAERNRLGTALMGKQYKDVAVMVAEGMDGIAAKTVIVGDEQLRAIKASAEAWEKFWDNLKRRSEAALGDMVTDMRAAASGWSKFAGDVSATFGGFFSGGLQGAGKGHLDFLNDLAAQQRAAAAATDERTKATGNGAAADEEARKKAKAYADAIEALEKKLGGAATREEIAKTAAAVSALHGKISEGELPALAKQTIEWAKAGYALPPVLEEIRKKQQALNDLLEDALKDEANTTASIKSRTEAEETLNNVLAKRVDLSKLPGNVKLASAYGGAEDFLRSITSRGVPQQILNVGTRVSLGDKPAEDAALKFGAKYSQTLISSMAGGGSPAKAIGSQIGSDLGSELAKKLAPKAIGSIAKAVVGAIPVIGSLAGPAIGLIMKAFHNEGADANKLRDSMKASLGGDASGKGLEDLVAKYKESTQVQTAYAAFLSAKTKDTVQKAFEDLKTALGAATTDVEAKAQRMAQALGVISNASANVTGAAVTTWQKAFEKISGLTSSSAQDTITQYRDLKAQMGAIDAERNKLLGRPLNSAESARAEELDRQWDDLRDKLRALQPEYDKVDAANRQLVAASQADFDRLSRITLASYNGYLAQGKSAVEAIQAVGPAIDNLASAADQFGFAGSAAFDKLKGWRDLVTANQPLLDQVAGLSDLLGALASVTEVDQQTFADFQAQAVSDFQAMTDAGFTAQQAERELAPLLEQIVQLHKDKGLAIDDATQALIDQARADGELKDKQTKSTADVVTALEHVADILDKRLPRAFAGAATSAESELDRIGRKATDVAGGIRDDFSDLNFSAHVDFGGSGSPDGATNTPGFAAGTPGLSYLRFSRRGTPVFLHNEEAVVPRGGAGTLAADIGRHLAGVVPRSAGAGEFVLNINDREFIRAVLPALAAEGRRMQATRR